MRSQFASLFSASALALVIALPAHAEINWTSVNQELGRDGAEQPGGVRRFSFPRSDMKVLIDGVEVKPGLALGGWLAFQPKQGNDAMVVGDLVLTQAEVGAVTKKLLESGIDVTAIHNHLLRAEPFPMYVHVEGNGDAVKLAQAFKAAIALTAIPAAAPAPRRTPMPNPSSRSPPPKAAAPPAARGPAPTSSSRSCACSPTCRASSSTW